MIKKVKTFFEKDIWLIEPKGFNRFRVFFIHQIRVFVLAAKGFNQDKGLLWASALTFYSLLSIVPVFALVFAISKGFGLEEKINELLYKELGAHQDVLENVTAFAHNMLENTKGGLIAGVGILVLLWSVIKVMSNIELSFNAIWGVKQPRPFFRKISDYLVIMLIAPLLLVLASSTTVYLSSSVETIIHSIDIEYVNKGARFFLNLFPYGIIWLLFGFLYVVMPNTKVEFKPAFFGAIISGSLFVLIQWIYVNFQIGVASYNAIYGSFAALPMFLAWVQLSWLIILFGGELSFAFQNVNQYRLEKESKNISLDYRRKITLFVLYYIIKPFTEAKEPYNFESLLKKTKLPYKLLKSVLFDLENAKIISKINLPEYQSYACQPAVDTDLLSIEFVIQQLENFGNDSDLPKPESSVFKAIEKALNENKKILLKEIY